VISRDCRAHFPATFTIHARLAGPLGSSREIVQLFVHKSVSASRQSPADEPLTVGLLCQCGIQRHDDGIAHLSGARLAHCSCFETGYGNPKRVNLNMAALPSFYLGRRCATLSQLSQSWGVAVGIQEVGFFGALGWLNQTRRRKNTRLVLKERIWPHHTTKRWTIISISSPGISQGGPPPRTLEEEFPSAPHGAFGEKRRPPSAAFSNSSSREEAVWTDGHAVVPTFRSVSSVHSGNFLG